MNNEPTVKQSLISSLLAMVIGVLYFYPLAYFWGYIAAYNPVHELLLDLARNDMPFAYLTLVSIQDFLINLVLMLPMALLVFHLLRPIGSWFYLILALISSEATEMYPVWSELDKYFASVGFLDYARYCIISMVPAMLDFWFIKKGLIFGSPKV